MLKVRTIAVAMLVGASLVVAVPTAGSGAVVGDEYGLVDPSTGEWHLFSGGQQTFRFYFGNPGDRPFMGDWDCDGIDTPGLYRQSDGYVYLRNSNTQGAANVTFFFGNPGDVPLAGDFNGDGCDTVSIYRPSTQTFYIINKLGTNDGGLGAADNAFVFGDPGDKPFVGDFNGNGVDTVGLHRESTGLVYYRNTSTQGNADNQFIYGDPGDRVVAGDWNASGVDSPGLFRPANATMYLRYENSQGNADEVWTVGESSWLPVAGSFGAPEAFLVSLEPVSGKPDGKGAAEVSGRVYQDSFQEATSGFQNSSEETTYLLGGLYDRFTALAGVRDDSYSNDAEFYIEMFDESTIRLWSGIVTIGSPVPIDIDVDGVLRLTIRVTARHSRDLVGIDIAVLADAKVGGAAIAIPKGAPLAPRPGTMFLIDLEPVANEPDGKGPASVSGTIYLNSFQEATSLFQNTSEETTYLLSNLYDKFTSLAGVRDDSINGDADFLIELFDEDGPLWSGSVTIGSPLPVSIDVSDTLRLTIRVTAQHSRDFGNDIAVLADARVGGSGLTPP